MAMAVQTSDAMATGERYVDMICTDHDLGLYAVSRVYLTPNGPVVEP